MTHAADGKGQTLYLPADDGIPDDRLFSSPQTALRHLGKRPGDYASVSPTDHVNLSQSTNDVYPTAVRLTILRDCPSLLDSQIALKAALLRKAAEFDHIIKVGRTQLMDAVPMRLTKRCIIWYSASASVMSNV